MRSKGAGVFVPQYLSVICWEILQLTEKLSGREIQKTEIRSPRKWWSSQVMGWRPRATAIFLYVHNSIKIRNVREPAKLLRIVLLKGRDTFKFFIYVSKRVILKPCDLYVYYSSLFLCILLTFRYSDFNSSKNKYFHLKYLFYCLLRKLSFQLNLWVETLR